MKLHRISRTEYIRDLSGEGAKRYGGRWNRPGLAALYTSEYKSLALLELLVHFNSRAAFSQPYSFVTLEVPENSIVTVSLDQLPSDYRAMNNLDFWQITQKYFVEKQTLGIRVPSVLVRDEYNVILNPMYKGYASKVRLVEIQPAWLDNRFLSLV